MTNEETIERLRILKQELKNVEGSKCLVYSRIVGYFQPTTQWNLGKLQEFHERKTFEVPNEKDGKSI
jgi:anaerobic ribonucleoside-triphosphate reductase